MTVEQEASTQPAQEERAIQIALQAMESALHSLSNGGIVEAKDALWQALAKIKKQ